MLEITRFENITAKPSEFHAVDVHVWKVALEVRDVIVRLYDGEAGVKIDIYYYLTEGHIMVYWKGSSYPRHVRFEAGNLEAMYDAFEEVKDLVQSILTVYDEEGAM